jgi:ankyrin repeat protein
LLVARGADPGATDDRGETALAIAAEERQAAVAELLRSK